MTRKQYIRKAQTLVIAIYNHPSNTMRSKYKLGEALRYARDHARMAADHAGSYEAAWNMIKMTRDFYGVN